jgi:hypothetical protein
MYRMCSRHVFSNYRSKYMYNMCNRQDLRGRCQ